MPDSESKNFSSKWTLLAGIGLALCLVGAPGFPVAQESAPQEIIESEQPSDEEAAPLTIIEPGPQVNLRVFENLDILPLIPPAGDLEISLPELRLIGPSDANTGRGGLITLPPSLPPLDLSGATPRPDSTPATALTQPEPEPEPAPPIEQLTPESQLLESETPALSLSGPDQALESQTQVPEEQAIVPLNGVPEAPVFNFIALLITAGAIALAIGMALWALRLNRNVRAVTSGWRTRFAVLEAKLDRAETIFNAQPDLVLVWDEDQEQPTSGFGRPKVLGNPATLSTLLSYAEGGDGATPVEGILYGLARQTIEQGDAVAALLRSEEDTAPGTEKTTPSLVEAVQDLRWNGATFSLVVKCFDGREIEVEGRPAGAQAVVWLTDVTSKGRGVNLLRDKLAQIREESDQIRGLLDAAPFPVWRRSSDLKLSWVNQAYADAVDLSNPDEVVNASMELDKATLALTHHVKETGKTGNEKQYVVINGRRRAFDLIEMPHEGGIFGMALDVTGADDAEQELQRHLDAHAQTLDKLATAVAIFGPEKKLQFYNQAYANLWRLDPAWLDASPSDSEILDRLHETRLLPEQADYKAWRDHRLTLYTEVSEQPDEMWHLPDSRHLRVACQPHPMGGLLFLFEDVTDRFSLESSLNTVMKVQKATLDNLNEGVAVFGSDGKMELYNKSFVEIWRLQSSKLKKQPHFTRVVEWCRPLFDEDQEWARMAERITSFSEERHPLAGRLERNDASVIDYAILPLPNGATLLTYLDVTDTTRITDALRERNEALETADRLKSEFISHVSYQLRTPLTSVKGFAEMLEGNMAGVLSQQQKDYSHAILEASNQLMVLMDDILDLARIDAGVMSLDLADVDLFSVLSNSQTLAQRRADESTITLELSVDPGIGTIYADERRLRQILFNLVTNAINYTGPSGIITIGAERAASEVRIWVADNGSGIAPQDQATIFDRFESKGAGGKQRGAGLGLSLVRSFVELHGGWVALDSTLQIGTKVVCHMPIEAQSEVDEPLPDQSAAE